MRQREPRVFGHQYGAMMRLRRAQYDLSLVRRMSAHYPPNHDPRVLWLRNAERKVLRALDELWGAQHREQHAGL